MNLENIDIEEIKRSLDKYEIDYDELEFTVNIGFGSSGKVFVGLYKGIQVAIKVLTSQFNTDVEEFKKEIEIMKDLDSPYTVKLYGATTHPSLCMVMEYCANGSLYSLLKKNQSLTWDRLLSYSQDMARGMVFLHNAQIVHRDLKSLNLLVTQEFNIKVADFGLSRHVKPSNMDTFKKLCGTFAYCAPEVFNGGTCTDKSDVFSMGIVIWEFLYVAMTNTYEDPYSEFNISYDYSLIYQTSRGLRPNIPKDTPQLIVELYLECVNGDPESRPSSLDVANQIDEIKRIFKDDRGQFDEKYDGSIEFKLFVEENQKKEKSRKKRKEKRRIIKKSKIILLKILCV